MNKSDRTTFLVPWQSIAQSNWTLDQVKYHYNIVRGKMLQNSAQSVDDQEVPYLKAQHVQWDGVRIQNLPTMWASPVEIEMLRVREGDLLVCEGGEGGRAAIVKNTPPMDCIIQNAIHLVRPKRSGDVGYLRYLLRHAASQEWLDVLCNKATIAHFTVETFGELWAWFPPIVTQRAISSFLDRETAAIDAMIDAKQRLLALLSEKRRALITNAIMRGIDPLTPLHKSGISWLGSVPKHWKIEYARWLFELVDVRSTTGSEDLLTVSHITGVTLRSEKDVHMFMAASLEGYKICQSGDLVINTLWAWMGAMGIAAQTGIVSPDYHVYRPSHLYDPRYLDFLVRMPIFASEVTRYSKGVWSSRLRLYPEEFFEIALPVPPLEEQIAIVHYLTTKTAKIDALALSTQKSIDLLLERRASLIAAAVTGQLNIER